MTSSSLIIHPQDIPEDGIQLEGSLPRSIFALKDELATPTSDLVYSLHASLMDDEVFVTGTLDATFDLVCVVTLKTFSHRIFLNPYSELIELENPEHLDLTDRLREDILLALPAYPRSPESEDQGFVLKDETLSTEGGKSVWDALDGLPRSENP